MNIGKIVLVLGVIWLAMFVVGKVMSLTYFLFRVAGQVAFVVFLIWIVMMVLGRSRK